MNEPSTEQQPTAAPARRRPIVVALGVLAVVVLALAAWAWTRPPSPDGTRDTALRGVLDHGGPAGWTLTRDPGLTPSDVEEWTEREGQPVLLGDDRFTVVWSTAATPDACTALAGWVTTRVATEAGKQITGSCPGALAVKSGDDSVFSTYGTDPGDHGRYLFVARVGSDTLFAGLTYEGPNALR